MANTKSANFVKTSSQYLSIADASQTGLDVSTAFTLEWWVEFDSISQQYYITKWGATDTNKSFSTDMSSATSWRLQVKNYPSQDNLTVTTPTFVVDTWYHLAVSWLGSSKTAKFYINGSQVGGDQTGSNVSSIYNGTEPFEIAGQSGAATVNGRMDEVIVWNDVRTSTEISDSYNSGDGKIYDGDEAGMVGYWRMEDNFLDETSNNNDLTNNNTVTYSTDIPFAGSTPSSFLSQIIMS